MKVLEFIKNWFRKEPVLFTYSYVSEMPDVLMENCIYIVEEDKNAWLVMLQCPCGCKEIIYLNLLRRTRPYWKISIRNKKYATIYPSIWKNSGCKSHFIIRDGSLIWY
jgi:hypothetical protein